MKEEKIKWRKNLGKRMRILNVGCGKDTYGTHFVDLVPTRDNVMKVDVDIEKLPFDSEFFHIIYSENLFEHLTNLNFALKEMYRVLKKGGKLILITDNANYWKWSLSPSHLGGGRDVNNHFELFTPSHLVNHAKKVGFKKIKTKYLDEYGQSAINFKILLIKMINYIISKTPFYRSAYGRIKIMAEK
jgi:predicted SAM-dependent methyltransferase